NTITFTDATHVTINVTVAGGATAGARNVTITNPDGQASTGTGILTIGGGCPAITVSPSTLPNGVVGTAYNQTITARGGTAPYTFAVTGGGSLPPPLTLNTSTGLISGTPNTAGLFSFTIAATDANACGGSRAYSVRVCPIITVTPATLPNGTVGTAYSQ